MNPRDTIAQALFNSAAEAANFDALKDMVKFRRKIADKQADAILSALLASGHRIVGPADMEVDGFSAWWEGSGRHAQYDHIAQQAAYAAWCAASPYMPVPAGWVSVTDKLPGEQGCDSENVLCFLNGHCELTDMECRNGGGWGIRIGFYDAEKQCFRAGGIAREVTHWMPLPSAPLASRPKGGA